MHLIKKIYRLQSKGVSKQAMARQLNLSRNTVKKYLRFVEQSGLSSKQLKALSDEELSQQFQQQTSNKPDRLKELEGYFAYIEKELRRVGVTRALLWQEYRVKHPQGYMFTQFCHHFKQWQDQSNVSLRMKHKAGDKLFLDYSGKKLFVTNSATGEVQHMEVFVAVLGASQLTYVEAVTSQQKEDFISCTENALRFYGGVPACITTDNLKAAVVKSNKYEPSLNETFADFADHYDTVVIPTRSYKPKDKALVENSVRIIYNRIYGVLRDEVFHSLAALNQAIRKALEVHNNTLFQNRPYSRRELFEQTEKETLQALPEARYELKHYAYGTVFKNAHIYLNKDKHYYSVPYHYVGKKVKIIYSPSLVQVYHKYLQISQHQRNRTPYEYSTINDHLPKKHQIIKQWSGPYFLEKAVFIGSACAEYVQLILDHARHPEQAYKSCQGILSLENKYGKQRLENACKRALHFEVYSYKSIRNILEKGWDKLSLPKNDQVTPIVPIHPNIRGKDYYK